MIYSIQGILQLKTSTSIIVNTQGIGYEILIPEPLIQSIGNNGDDIQLYTYHHIREDSMQLFGFSTLEDRQFFIKLTSVSGVGPKVGLKILSTLSVSQLVHALLTENLIQLTSVSGVGKKMAERMVVELKDKVSEFAISADSDITIQANEPNLKQQENDDIILGRKDLLRKKVNADSKQIRVR